jgi:hypothetical protein
MSPRAYSDDVEPALGDASTVIENGTVMSD